MWLYVGNTRVAPVLRVMPNFKGTYNLIDNLELTLDATEAQITAALVSAVNNPLRYDYCLVEKPWYQVYEGYASFTSVDDYIGYYVIYNDAYVLIDDSNKSSSGITVGTTIAYILNNAYSVVRYNFDGTDWTSADNSGYANIDASNFTDSGTTFLSGLGMPSDRYETLTVGASAQDYVAPANGMFWGDCQGNNNASNYIVAAKIVNGSFLYRNAIIAPGYGGSFTFFLNVKQGDTMRLYWSNSVHNVSLKFIYAEGNPTPPQP